MLIITTFVFAQEVEIPSRIELKENYLKNYYSSDKIQGIWQCTELFGRRMYYPDGHEILIGNFQSDFYLFFTKDTINHNSYISYVSDKVSLENGNSWDSLLSVLRRHELKLDVTASENLYRVYYDNPTDGLFTDNILMEKDGVLYIEFTKKNYLDGDYKKEGPYGFQWYKFSLVKIFPTKNDIIKYYGDDLNTNKSQSGTGFALSSDGLIVTNYHVVNGSSNIKVRGVKGDFSKVYSAKILAEDKNNDLVVLKIEDEKFTSLGTLPYTIKNTTSEVGKDVFALGYPLRATMGDEVKLTNGIISSKTGFQGDITSYQVSVPIQPGNSGGPLFDSKGNVIGIINAKHKGTDNVSYAIKSSYLFNLFQVMDKQPVLPKTNTISAKNLSDQVKYVKEFVYIIEVN